MVFDVGEEQRAAAIEDLRAEAGRYLNLVTVARDASE